MEKELQKRIISSLVLVPTALFFIIKGSIFFIFFLSVCFLITSYEWHQMSKNKSYNIPGHFFLVISFYFAYLWRHYLSLDAELFLFVILICVSTDIGGYTIGKIFKGPKLTKISPNKTYSGALGSIILSLITVLLLTYYFVKIIDLKIAIVAIMTSIFCQIGDLTFSFLKRKARLQDTGKILPGHGGILDRLDGILLGVPLGFVTFVLIY